ncbi:L-threonylcarbamoyladenylate synthase [Actinomyces minihominis]|uniref:L-threonylcarbamoyladenylate synthase n=1 Tax=Actinomyces minihominis TaxID=2002838 RepID=UPI000C085A49|nr:L-threonylcarbamoyladenylate synthase [Actinomyces minihominis]
MAVYRDVAPLFNRGENDLPEEVASRLLDAVGRGELVVLPTDTVYGIGADPFSSLAVMRLLGAKGRDNSMPPPVLGAFTEELLGLCKFTSLEQRDVVTALADAFWPGPLTIIAPAAVQFGWDGSSVGDTIAVRMPQSELALSALQMTGPLAVTSANRTGFPPSETVEEAHEYFGSEVAVYVDGGPSPLGQASTIVDCTGATPRLIRAGAITLKQIQELLKSI